MSIPNPRMPLAFEFSGPIHGQFVKQIESERTANAIVSSDGTCSYGELNLITNRLAQFLLGHGIGHGQTVAILADRSPALVYAMLGVSKCGASFYVADAAYPTARILECLERVAPAFLLVAGELVLPPELEAQFSTSNGDKVLRVPSQSCKAFQALAEYDDSLPQVTVALDDIAYIGFTSGSTGHPKGIATTHAPLVHFINWHVKQHRLSSDDQFSLLSGLSHDPVMRDIFTPLSIGATLHIPPQSTIFEPTQLYEWLSEHQITICHLTPSLGEIIVAGAQGRPPLDCLRYCLWGGEILRSRVSRAISSAAPNVNQVNFYGATETPQAMGHFPIDRYSELESFPIGKGIDDVQLLVVDSRGATLEIGQVGEIWIRTRYLAQGYLGDSEQTAGKFISNPYGNDVLDRCYRTGDEGRYLADGNVEFVGRSDHQVKIRGFRVELGEIANRLERCPGIEKAIVLARDVPGRDRVLVAYLAYEPNKDDTLAAVRNRLKLELPSYMVPAFIIPVKKFPLLPNGKVDLSALPAIDVQMEAPAASYVAPSTERELELASVWQELLGIAKVGVNDSFIDLGGDSITAIRALMRMRQLGISDDLSRGIFQGKTIAEIAREEANGDSGSRTRQMPQEVKTTLAVNVLRGILISILVAAHWAEGFLNRLPASAHWLLNFLAPLFNVAAPGFAFVFGLGLGYVHFSMHRSSPQRAASSLRFGALLVGMGILVENGFGLTAASMHGVRITSHIFFLGFFGALMYYVLALVTVPWWFRFIARFRNELLGCAVLAVLAFALDRAAVYLLVAREQVGFLQLCRLMLVGKYSYFNMSLGVIGGIATGVQVKRWSRRPTLSLALMAIGAVLVALGVALLYVQTGALDGFSYGEDMSIWRWVFYSGNLLLVMGLVRKALTYYESMPSLTQAAFRWIAVLGQCALPIVVLHGLVLKGKAILKGLGLPEVVSLTIPLLIFFAAIGIAAYRIHALFYGTGSGTPTLRKRQSGDALRGASLDESN